MEVPEIKIPKPERVHLNQLILDQTNPNEMNQEEIEALKTSIKKYGFIQPIITNKDFKIVDGHQRWKAARELLMSEVLVIRLPLERVDAVMLRHVANKLKGRHNHDKDLIDFKFLEDQDMLDEFEELLPNQDIDKMLEDAKKTEKEIDRLDKEMNKLDKDSTPVIQQKDLLIIHMNSTKERDLIKRFFEIDVSNKSINSKEAAEIIKRKTKQI